MREALMHVFSPGEVIFFGEHSVVYGRPAMAAAISRGILAHGILRRDGQVRVRSALGTLHAGILADRSLRAHGDCPDEMRVFLDLVGLIAKQYQGFSGADIDIDSDIPAQAGLASSAAVSAASLKLLTELLGDTLSEESLIERYVFNGEILIQKRGSILGSVCTVNGGFVEVVDGKWRRLPEPAQLPIVTVIDTLERCATSVTTQRVADRLKKDSAGTERLFDRMAQLAGEGQEAVYAGDWARAGSCMTQNQACLKELGVSTAKVDAILEAIADRVYGAKITGAGGGGCLVCLPKDQEDKRIDQIVQALGGEVLPATIELNGVRVTEEDDLCRL